MSEREELLAQALSLIHDALHKGDLASAHDIAHRALGINGDEFDPNGPRFFRDFDAAFTTAVRKHNVPAAYIVFDAPDRSKPQAIRLVTGGHAMSVRMLKMIVAKGLPAVAEPGSVRLNAQAS